MTSRTPGNLYRVIMHLLLGLFAIITLVPFVWMICGSLKSAEDFFGALFLPSGEGTFGIAWDRLTLDNYREILGGRKADFLRAGMNSVLLASATSLLATLFAAMGGYALAKFEFRAKRLITGLVLLVLLVPAPLLLAPTYQLLYQLGLLDTYMGLILPAAGSAFGVFLFRQAMLNSIPNALIESARIDGCGETRIFFSIILPLVRPMTGAFLMITFLATWNNFITPQVILQSPENFPLAVAIANLRDAYNSQEYGIFTAATLFSIAPIACLFLFLQREYLQGLTSGAVKG